MRSAPIPALRSLLGIESLQDSISAQAAEAHYQIKNVYKVKLVEGSGLRKFRPEEVLGMLSSRTPRTFFFDRKYNICLPSMEDWETGILLLPRKGDIWYTDRSKKEGILQEWVCSGAGEVRA